MKRRNRHAPRVDVLERRLPHDGDERIDEGFLGSAPDCAAPSCVAIQQAGAQFGTGTYFVTSAPGVPTTCAFD